MKITKTASGKKTIKISKSEWQSIGKKAGWIKKEAQPHYDDNFGHWEMEDSEDIDFYNQVQKESVEKECKGCGETVRIRPQYAYCNRCADLMEQGYDFG
jgi:hypothetical protein